MIAVIASAIFLAAVVLAAESADAQAIDLSAISCKEFIELPRETATAIVMWLDGYLTDDDDPALVDVAKTKAKAERLVAHCTQNPALSFMAAAEDVMGK
jgi:HdeA/HdeB family